MKDAGYTVVEKCAMVGVCFCGRLSECCRHTANGVNLGKCSSRSAG
jgi:hypothetical protein